MPRWDLRCTCCVLVLVDMRGPSLEQILADHRTCPRCGARGTIVWSPSPAAFVVKGFNAKNGYSK